MFHAFPLSGYKMASNQPPLTHPAPEETRAASAASAAAAAPSAAAEAEAQATAVQVADTGDARTRRAEFRALRGHLEARLQDFMADMAQQGQQQALQQDQMQALLEQCTLQQAQLLHAQTAAAKSADGGAAATARPRMKLERHDVFSDTISTGLGSEPGVGAHALARPLDAKQNEAVCLLFQSQLLRLNAGKTSPAEAWRILFPTVATLSRRQSHGLLERACQAVEPLLGLGLEFSGLMDHALGSAISMPAAMEAIEKSLALYEPDPDAAALERSGILRLTVEASLAIRMKGGQGSFISHPGRHARDRKDLNDLAVRHVATMKSSKAAQITGLVGDTTFWRFIHATFINNGLDDRFRDDIIDRTGWTLGPLPPWGDGSGLRPILDKHGCGLENPAVLLRFRADAGNFQRPQREQHLRMSARVAAIKATADSAKRVATSAAAKKN